MIETKYIIRLDDACPSFDQHRWLKLEKILDQFGVTPIIAVVPNNLDPNLSKYDEWPEFWEWIKKKQDVDDWIIAVHGNNHIAENKKSGILGVNKKSEFSGISQSEQESKIITAISSFKKNGLKTDVFVAPYHSFDFQTLKLLRKHHFKFVSDGPGNSPFCFLGLKFIPQQLWKYKSFPKGVWTICLHPNTMTDLEIDKIEEALINYSTYFIKSKTELEDLEFKTNHLKLFWDYVLMRTRRFLIKILIRLQCYLRFE